MPTAPPDLEFRQQFSQRLRQYSLEHKVTQRELALLLGVSPMTLSSYYRGYSLPGSEVLLRAITELGIQFQVRGERVAARGGNDSHLPDGRQLTLTLQEPEPVSPEIEHEPHVELVDVSRLLIERIIRNPSELYAIEPDQFQGLILDRLISMGMDAQPVGHTYQKDGGIDIIFFPKAPAAFPFLGAVQVKHHRSRRNKEGPGSVREFAGALQSGPFNAGLLVTNTSFSIDAQWAAAQHPSLIRLRGFPDLIRWFMGNFTDDAEWREIPTSIQLCPGVSVELRTPSRR